MGREDGKRQRALESKGNEQRGGLGNLNASHFHVTFVVKGSPIKVSAGLVPGSFVVHLPYPPPFITLEMCV